MKLLAAEGPYILLWILIEGWNALDAEYRGFTSTLFLAGLVPVALMCVGGEARIAQVSRPRLLVLGLSTLLILHLGECLSSLRSSSIIDIGSTTLASAQALAQGLNPYTMPIDPGGMTLLGPEFGGFKYLPVMSVAYMPLGLLLGVRGMRVTNLLLDLAATWLIVRIAAREGGRATGLIAAITYLSLPLVIRQLYHIGVTDLIAVDLLLAAVLLNGRHSAWSGLFVGLSISSKLLPGAVVLPACIPKRARMAFAAGLCVGLSPTLAVALSAPHAFLDNIVLFNILRPMEADSWVARLGPVAGSLARAAIGVAWSALAVWSFRTVESPATRAGAMAGLMLCVILAGGSPHWNYVLWCVPFLCITVTCFPAFGTIAIRREELGPVRRPDAAASRPIADVEAKHAAARLASGADE